MRISDWSSDVCSSDLAALWPDEGCRTRQSAHRPLALGRCPTPSGQCVRHAVEHGRLPDQAQARPEEHTSELQSLMRISYAVFCLKKKTQNTKKHTITHN